MIRGSKVRSIASFEFLSTVKRKAYLITTFGMPVFVLMYMGFFSLIGVASERKEASEVRVFGVVDGAGLLAMDGDVDASPPEIPEQLRATLEASGRTQGLDQALGWLGNTVYRPFADRDAAVEAIVEGEIQGCFVMKPDFIETGFLEVYFLDEVDFGVEGARRSLGRLIGNRLLDGKVSEEIAERVRRPFAQRDEWNVTADGEIKPRSIAGMVTRLVVPIVFTILLFISIMMSASYLLQATAAEKENKVVEVLLSSANPDEILTGKLLGLGLAGILQVLVWFGMILVAGGATATTLASLGVDIPWLGIVTAVVYFPAAYLFLGSLMLGTGALGSNLKESNQMSMIWSLPSAAPLMFLGLLIQDPHSLLAKILTWIPLTAPGTVIFRTTIDPAGIAWWEIVGPLLLVLVCTWFAIRIGARLFRVGLLLTGARPKLREILRQARLQA
jgi:ABC-2 type transport system permease protein